MSEPTKQPIAGEYIANRVRKMFDDAELKIPPRQQALPSGYSTKTEPPTFSKKL